MGFDRISKFPGRVKLIPVPGQSDLFDIERADNPIDPGRPLNAETLFSAEVSALFGFGLDGVPSDALGALAFASNYVWRKTIGAYGFGLGEDGILQTSQESYANTRFTVYYTDTIDVDPETGVVTTGDILSVSTTYQDYTNLAPLRGNFWCRTLAGFDTLTGVGWSPLDAELSQGTPNASTYIEGKPVLKLLPTSETVPAFSPDINGFPHDGHYDGDLYFFLGLFKDVATLPTIPVSGIYTGSGITNSQKITLGFRPKIVLIMPRGGRIPQGDADIPVAMALDGENAQYVVIEGDGFTVSGIINVQVGSTTSYINRNPLRFIAWR